MNPHLREVAAVALKVGTLGFGGPAAHVAMLREEVVANRKWMSDDEFVDLLGVTNIIPGPNSTELMMYAGYARAGFTGFLLAGAAFITPAALIVGALAMLYVKYGQLPSFEALLFGIRPVIVAIVIHAGIALVRPAIRSITSSFIAVATLALYFTGVSEIVLILGAGLLTLMLMKMGTSPPRLPMLLALPMSAPLTDLTLSFLKIGAMLYGSGYVLLTFMRREFVERRNLLTDTQLLDAISVGQFTPGPVLTTATFVGYLLAGGSGAVLATMAIFTPAFVLVAITRPFLARLRRSPAAGAFLDGVNAAALALLVAVALQLAGKAIVDPITAILAILALAILTTTKINSAWLVIFGGLAGLIAVRLA